MPRLKFDVGVSADEAAKAEAGSGGSFYDEAELGVPPVGVYRGNVKRLSLKKQKKDPSVWMLNCVIEINEPSSSKKSKYNGYGVWWNGNITKQGMGHVNQFIDALNGGDAKKAKKSFWDGGPKIDDTKAQQPKVLALGPDLKILEEMPIIMSTRSGAKLDGSPKLDVAEFLISQKSKDEDDDDDDDDEEYDDDTEPEDDEDDEEDGEQTKSDKDDDEPPF